ncbi:MAG: efflux RND transporter permease subunit [Methylovirgula sp.]|jgi:HAE1 family hydrophobic/amphiphilic exporter-1/multidrug efflux pump
MNISAPFIERPIATSLLMAAIALVGIIAYPMLPRAPLPQIDFPTISVSAQLPGASPETMASSVATPLETQFAQIPGLTQLTSVSGLGTTQITAQFDLDRNIDGAAQDILAAINAAGGQLPKNLPSPPTYRKINPSDAPVLMLAAKSDTLPITVVDDYAENVVAQQLSQLTGVGQVLVVGQQKPSVRVQVDPAKLAYLGLSLEDVRMVIANATVDSPKGMFDGPHQGFTVYTNDQILKAAPWNNIVIAYRHGAPVRIKDIGVAVDAPENTHVGAWANGTPCIQLFVFKQAGANVIDTVDRVKADMPRLKASIPHAMDVYVVQDRTQTIRSSVDDVQFTMLITISLVVMVIFLFLRSFWATVIPGITIPMSILGTFALMHVFGYSLDNLSLMALTIAVGFVVDDAIVMLENIYRHIEDGMSPMAAAFKGAGEIAFTIVSMSVSLVAVFIPLLFMGGIVGRLFREFAVTVTLTIFVSAVVSLTLSPMMASRWLKPHGAEKHGKLYLWIEAGFDWLADFYAKGLRFVLSHQFLTLMSVLVTVAINVYLYAVVPKGFFPQQDTGQVQGFAVGAQDISLDAMKGKEKQFAHIIAKDPDVTAVDYSAGPIAGSQTENVGRFWLGLKPRSQRIGSADDLINRLRPQLEKVEGASLFLQVPQDLNVGGRLSRTQYQYTLQDANLDELNQWAPRMFEKLKALPILQDVASDQQTDAPIVSVTIDRDTASRFGIQPQLIDDTLYDAVGQRQVTQYFTQLNQYHVVLEITPALQADPAILSKIYVKSPITNEMVPLATFAKVDSNHTTYLSISHQGQFPAVTLSFNLKPGVALGQAVDAIQKIEAEINKPESLIATFQGNAQAFQDSLKSQPILILLAIIAVYIVLGMLYESYIHPITILSTLPSAGVGALLILIAFGYDLTVIALIGIILLIGIVKKNAIMMIDFALNRMRNEGLSARDAIYSAAVIRFRPIMMTTMAAILGGLPLMLGTGTGSELRRPLGFAIVGGLVVSQILTLYTVPVIFLYMDRLNDLLSGRRKKSKKPPAPALAVDADHRAAAE